MKIHSGFVALTLLCSAWGQATEAPSSHKHAMEHSMIQDHTQNNTRKMSSDKHAAHRTAMKKTRYSITTEQYSVPIVTLINQFGVSVALPELLNSNDPVAMNFIFTTCTTICPVMTATFAKMRQELGKDADQLRMVSISIDPEYDRPDVLKAYAKKFHADANWHFLTGNGDDIHQVLKEFENLFGSKMNHQPVTLLKKPEDPTWVRIDGLAQGKDLANEVRTRLLN